MVKPDLPPHLSEWMGKSPRHPLRPLIGLPFSDVRAVLTHIDDLLTVVQDAAPVRWQSKRRDFQGLTGFSGFLNLRAELLVAANLIASGVDFSFGGGKDPQPDLVLT